MLKWNLGILQLALSATSPTMSCHQSSGAAPPRSKELPPPPPPPPPLAQEAPSPPILEPASSPPGRRPPTGPAGPITSMNTPPYLSCLTPYY